MRRYSDRVIARAVGLDRHRVQRYKSPETPTGASAPVSAKAVGEDGKVRMTGDEWSLAAAAIE